MAAPSIEMHRLRPPPSSNVSALMVKLTDESLAALKAARSAGHKMRLVVDGQGGGLEIGDGVAKFRFVVQQLPGPTSDVIHWRQGLGYSTVASIATKIQIQATDKTFAETREKAQKMVEEEKKKATKDVTRRPRDQRAIVHRPVSHSTSRFARPSSSTAPQPKPWTDTTSSKISPPKAPASTATGQTARPSMSSALRVELMKKSLRQRVVHAVVLNKYTRDGVLEKLRKDGLNDGDEQRAGTIIDDVSETGKDGRLSLKSTLFSEVDANKWQWFTTDEKVTVKRILSGAASSTSASFAPMRKSAMAPPQAPGPAASSTTPSDAVAVPAKSSPPSKSPANGNPLDELLPPAKRKRESHSTQALTNGTAEKRPLHCQSPPEDPKDSPPSMNGSRPAPSCNWDRYFPDIHSDAEAERYYGLFQTDYPLYMNCYKTLSDVAKEFSDLERQLSEAPMNTKEHEKVERSIQTKFSHYQKDGDFQRTRQQHGDLRAKLAVLKKRISDWERQSQTQNQPPHPADSPHLQHVDDLMVM